MFAFWYCLGGCFSSDRKKEEDLHGFVPKKGDNDDLKIIEWIGPKIEEVLNRGGITSFKQLKSASVTDLKLILAKWGKQFGLANPKTWPEQADLAHWGKWKELKEYQEFLVGGI
jgi:predicted flap endonuclease-1-like 5' DNA nuclease